MAKNIASVIIEYSELVSGKNLQPLIEQAYGPKGNSDDIKVMAFFLSMAYPTILNNARKLCLFSTKWLTFPKKL